MRKLKAGKCLYCSKPMQRHDANRVSIVAGKNNGKDCHKQSHLSCLPDVAKNRRGK